MYKRRQYRELESRLSEERGMIQVVSGPRQVGKSTMIRQVLENTSIPHMMVSADAVPKNNIAWIGEMWDTARARMKAGKYGEYLLVIDEVHKLDNWSEEVKKQWDADTFSGTNMKVVILGSSRLLLKDGLTESLAGRYELIRMPHWGYEEMRDAFGMDIDRYVYFGGYPGGARLVENETRWRRYIKDSIIAPAIEKAGEEISLTKLLGQLQDAGNVTTLAGYLTTLAESQLLCGLQKYANDNARKYNSVPKLMVYNTSLLSALSGVTFKKAFITPALWGRWVESAVGAHILNKAEELDFKVYYWREKNNEVDFIIEYDRRCVAVEVKSGHRTVNEGLPVFGGKFHPVHSFVVGSGGVPLEEFLSWDLSALFE